MNKSRRTHGSAGTREALLLAGERLIAELGIDGVSLRQINTEAGQRNSSAAHYHFGSKEALVRAIFEYRMENVNRKRQAKLTDMLACCPGNPQPRQLIATLVDPVVDEIETSDGGSHYIRFLSQAISHPQTDTNQYMQTLQADAASTIFKLLRRSLPDIPETILGQRFGLMWEMIIHSLADRERDSELKARSQHIDKKLFIHNLIDTATGALTASVDSRTSAALQDQPSQ